MYCPDCGYDAGEANFCPECGSDLGALKSARKNVKTTGDQRRSGGGRAAGDGGAAAARPAPQPRAKGGLSTTATIWILVAIAAVAAFAVVYILNSRGKQQQREHADDVRARPVTADTSGTYSELVARANGLYDQGAPLIQKNDLAGASPYFAAAAKVYAAAWKKQPGDPAVGTDYATSLFYSGDVEGAVKQVDKVLAKNPTFQNALYNRGNFLAMQARVAQQNGQKAKADRLFAQAKASYEAAINVDATSDSGQAAAQALKSL